jgi:hypothetical protein
MPQVFEYPFDDTYQQPVDANGDCVVRFAPGFSVNWNVSQVSIEMQTAPSGAVCELRKNGAFVSFMIATGDAAGGDPSIFLRPGDYMEVIWSNCTPQDLGRVFVVYEKVGF